MGTRGVVKKTTEEWCAFMDQFGVWRKTRTDDHLMIPDRTQVRLFKTEEAVDSFLAPTPKNTKDFM